MGGGGALRFIYISAYWVFTHARVCVHAHVCARVHARVRAHVCMHACVHVHTLTYVGALAIRLLRKVETVSQA